MKQKNDANINIASETRGHFDQCSDPVQTLQPATFPVSALRRLRFFTLTMLHAHNQRVSALGVYRRRRIDGASLGERES
jgi:hypothetical protein